MQKIIKDIPQVTLKLGLYRIMIRDFNYLCTVYICYV